MKKGKWNASHRIPIYGGTLCVGVGNNPEESCRGLFCSDEDREHYDAFCISHGSKVGVFFERRTLTHATVAHECFHALHHLAKHFGWNFGTTGEPEAYLLSWIIERVYQDLARHNESVN